MVTIEDLKHALNWNSDSVIDTWFDILLKSLPLVLVSASRDELAIYIIADKFYFGTSTQLFVNGKWQTILGQYKIYGNRYRSLKLGNRWELLLEYATEHGYI